jgi:hypothetical protein
MQGIRRRQRGTVAAWLLMLGLCLAPSLALAASVCAPSCCPVEAEREDCGAGFASRACCATASTPLASVAPTPAETPSLPTLPWRDVVLAPERIDSGGRFTEAERALRASPLRLSVVLLI